jgi:hypothetical protein
LDRLFGRQTQPVVGSWSFAGGPDGSPGREGPMLDTSAGS